MMAGMDGDAQRVDMSRADYLVDMNQDQIVSMYGLKAIATVVFDIDSGQRLDALYPATCDLSEDARKSIAHLALPHSNKQDEGDTQFTVRFREGLGRRGFLYGFVLFRQQRDTTRSRGYLQRALVIVSTRPYVDLFDRILRVMGPLFFQAGNSVLEALYENIAQWPIPVHNSPLSLPLAGTFISCIIPNLTDYSHVDEEPIEEPGSPSPTGHFIADDDEEGDDFADDDDMNQGNDGESDSERDVSPARSVNGKPRLGGDENAVRVKAGRFVVTTHVAPPSPSFGDVLLSKRRHHSTAFESVGLYSSFMGLESCLWQLWQLAITGESLIILSPHARTCSQATLAFTSLISPLAFGGDYRPYYALYEADFDELSSRQQNGVSSTDDMTVIGTTNPFFIKSFKRWPNAVVFPFLEPSADEGSRNRARSNLLSVVDKEADNGCISIRIKQNVDLDVLQDHERAQILRRRPRCVIPDAAVLNQLVSPPQVFVTQTASTEEEPYATINNAILRRHFRKLTKEFLRPFESYFGIWKSSGTNSHLYSSVNDLLKPFDSESFLASVNPRQLPIQIKRSKWRTLYLGFIKSPHFQPWFTFKRNQCVYHFTRTLRALRVNVSADMLLSSPCGDKLSLSECLALKSEIDEAHNEEQGRADMGKYVDDEQLRTIRRHLDAVTRRIQELQ